MGNLTPRRPSRGGSGALGEWARPFGHSTLVAGCGVIALLAMQNSYLLPTLVLAIVFSIVVVGLDVQLGYARQLVFSQPVFMAVGAYSTGYLTSVQQMGTVPAFLIGLGISLVLAVVVALAVSRARGIALTIVTVFLVLILTNILSVTKSLGGTDGLAGIPAAAIGGHEISTPLQFGWLALVVLVLCVGVASRFVHSGTGVEVALAAESEEAARAFGVHVARRRLLVFVFAAVCADIAGSLYAQSQGFVSPDGFNITLAMNLLLMLYLGGKRSVIGGIAGSVILTFLPVVFAGIADYFLLVEGAAFILVLLVAPDGIVGLASTGVRRLAARWGVRFGRAHLSGAVTGEEATTPAHAATVDTVVHARDLTKRYSGITAVNELSLAVPGTGITAVIGPNGAGKSTFFDLIAGAQRSDAGTLQFRGADVTGEPDWRRARMGVARTFQRVRLAGELSVLDNVAAGSRLANKAGLVRTLFVPNLTRARRAAWRTLERMELSHLAAVRPGELTLANQRMVELARCLAGSPALLLLDEPASGLSDSQRSDLAQVLNALENVPVLIIEHDLDFVGALTDHVVVVALGETIFDGRFDELAADRGVADAFLSAGRHKANGESRTEDADRSLEAATGAPTGDG
ncbi:ATP-binding cassette domain-containing protein [Streptosporangium sp. 'caverna']|uniref:branched-chain amino acid ABC transporter ATP-binding protein/permease n=1 Tax=Streptosporangium sp. 'caverna' TaxID=2202249 RepID=UPI000D7DA89B|nr:ATP-binding cassette domain-containing protein [Streptosporangium sp. 'caverna']AWS43377.1 hypothetical protein DKM19_20350 [Streptosporangium sp. 'caverna']